MHLCINRCARCELARNHIICIVPDIVLDITLLFKLGRRDRMSETGTFGGLVEL
jgi:hypothetical protein